MDFTPCAIPFMPHCSSPCHNPGSHQLTGGDPGAVAACSAPTYRNNPLPTTLVLLPPQPEQQDRWDAEPSDQSEELVAAGEEPDEGNQCHTYGDTDEVVEGVVLVVSGQRFTPDRSMKAVTRRMRTTMKTTSSSIPSLPPEPTTLTAARVQTEDGCGVVTHVVGRVPGFQLPRTSHQILRLGEIPRVVTFVGVVPVGGAILFEVNEVAVAAKLRFGGEPLHCSTPHAARASTAPVIAAAMVTIDLMRCPSSIGNREGQR